MPLKLTDNGAPAQTVTFATELTVGVGKMMISNVSFAPTQPFKVGVATICAVCRVATAAEVKLILPVPFAAKPMVVLSFVQFMVGVFGEAVKLTATSCPPQAILSAVATTLGTGFIVIVNVVGVPIQLFNNGVTEMVAVWVLNTEGAFKTEILPEPEAAKPTAVFVFVQL